MKNGGRIPRNVAVICETFKTYNQTKNPYERRFGEPFKGPINYFFWSKWLEIMRSLQKIKQEFTNLTRK